MNSWNRFCDHFLWWEAEGFGLDTSRSPLPDGLLQKFPSTFSGLMAHLKAIESGGKVNVDEKRAVGHYWLRAPELAPRSEITNAISSTLEKIDAFVQRVHS